MFALLERSLNPMDIYMLKLDFTLYKNYFILHLKYFAQCAPPIHKNAYGSCTPFENVGVTNQMSSTNAHG